MKPGSMHEFAPAAAATTAPDDANRRVQILTLATEALDRRRARRAAMPRALAGVAVLAVAATALAVALPRPARPAGTAAAIPAPVVHRSPDAFPRANVRVIDDLELRAVLEAAGYRVEIIRVSDTVLVRIDGETLVAPTR